MSKRLIDTKTSFSTADYKGLSESKNVKYLKIDLVNKDIQEEEEQTINKEPYLPNPKLAEAVNLAIALGRPLLLQGEPGCEKTRVAYAVAYALGLPLQVSYLKSTSRAQDLLYTYDAVNRLYNAQLRPDERQKKDGEPIDLDIKNYIHLGPLGIAIARAQYGHRSVVLIDEIDKADLDFPNDLLWELDRLEFRVTEAPEIHYNVGNNPRPIIFVTHNEEKALPTAFLRRCIFHYVEFPQDEELLLEILKTHQITDQELSKKAIEVLLSLRKLDLSKRPGLSELLDWVGYLEAVKTPVQDLDKLPYIGTLLKQEIDCQRAMGGF